MTVEAFLEECRAEPVLAAEHLQRGYFEFWLRDAGRPDLAELAEELRQGGGDPAASLAQFLEDATPARPFDPAGWPSAALAFEFVRPSYELVARRYEAVENRGRALLTFASSLTVAAPAFTVAVMGSAAPPFSSLMFILAVVAFAGVLVCAVLLARVGKLRFIDLQILYDSYLDCSETEFRLTILGFASQHFASNSRVVTWLGRITDAMSFMLLIEAAALAAWIFWDRRELSVPWI